MFAFVLGRPGPRCLEPSCFALYRTETGTNTLDPFSAPYGVTITLDPFLDPYENVDSAVLQCSHIGILGDHAVPGSQLSVMLQCRGNEHSINRIPMDVRKEGRPRCNARRERQ